MQITDIISQMGGLQTMAKELGINETQAAAGIEALAPAILGGLKKQPQSSSQEGLGGLLSQLGGGNLLDQVLAPQPTDPSQGNAVLGQIFGSPDVSRAVADNAASQSGLDTSILRKMLPLLAMAVTGLMAKQSAGEASQFASDTSGGLAGLGGQGGLGGMLGGLLGGQQNSPDAGSGLLAMLDQNGDGNALDDILGMVGKTIR